ncbi:type IVB secretion system protein IcmH/DotU [Massilia sp. TS11]|uniref:type IVB secretion system protein IcmH/DotU n=1 Tax=Massilia sp. TS11 TaxID=2908003 RepID=UPI001EDA5091|nr:type IVB secretion system protein IcmH/DotU [Massilia sp. TS11]MCG2584204.1 type IVB secretion system protein IcmH/DotU [Massilia sp. TS11]
MASQQRRIDRRTTPEPSTGALPQPSLADLMADGFQAMLLLQRGCGPRPETDLAEQLIRFLGQVDSRARQLAMPHEDVQDAKYAYCAALDEIVLGSTFSIRQQWETRPLQLRLFGDQLAGEHFFNKLENWRARGSAHVGVLEVFHLCLLLGFRGKYALDEDGKLHALRLRLGEEITRMQGKAPAFAPHAERPDRIAYELHSERSLVIACAVMLLASAAVFGLLRWQLHRQTVAVLGKPEVLISMPARPANFTVHLP